MYIYWEECEQGQLLKVPDNVSWQLSCENYGPELNLHVGEETYSIHDASISWLIDYPRMGDFLVEEYYTAVVKAVSKLIVENEPNFIDLQELEDRVLEPFWAKWKEKGYVEEA